MRVAILGPLEVVVDGQAVRIGGARLRTMLIRLALDAGRVVTVDSLTSALWPDGGPTEPSHALQSVVSRLRVTMNGRMPLRSASGGYCLDLPPEAVDVLRFELLARQGRQSLRAGDPDGAVRLLREALDLWRGEPLADVAAAPFAAATVVRLEELRLAAIEDRVEAELETSTGHLHAVAELDELVATYPLREKFRVLLVRTLHGDGRQAEALASYEAYRKLLAEELGTDPGQELQEAHLAALRDTPAPPQRPAARRTGNLRVAYSSFIGRTEELSRATEQLRQSRLVTLVGPGGVGKTRLATTVLAELADSTPGGVWMVELASVTDPDGLVRAVMGALGLREVRLLDGREASPDPVGRLVEAFGTTEALVLLDNCEHLLSAAARLVDELLGRCPGLRMLATSREPLDVPGETLCVVPPLGLPEPDTSDAMDYPAVRLFADRVAAARPDFEITADNVAAVVDICRRLDGLPLAIELAAARLRTLPLEQLAVRLDDRFRLLSGGSRTALPRHQTLRAVVAWSWDMLDDTERRLAARLAVFPGDITLDGAEGVCSRGGLAADTLLDHISALADKSLLQVLDGPDARYRMLETIREYALERLADSGEIVQARRDHTAYFLELAERAAPGLRGPDQLTWIVRLTAERDNLMATLHRALGSGEADTAVRLAAALGPFWTIQGNHAEAANRIFQALQVPGQHPPDARAIATAFYLFNRLLAGGGAFSSLVMEDAWALASDVSRAARYPTAALIEASLALTTDDADWGLSAIDRDLPRCDPWGRAMLLMLRAFFQSNHGDMPGSRQTLSAAATAFREAGERWGLSLTLTALADAHCVLGDFDDAITELKEALRLLRELNPKDEAIMQRTALAAARAQSGDMDRARAELAELVRPGTGLSSARHHLMVRIALGNLARHAGDMAEAAQQFDHAYRQLGRLPVAAPLFRAILGAALGQLAVAEDDLDTARAHLEEAFTLAAAVPDMPVVAGVSVGVAGLRAGQGAADEAAEILGATHTLRGAPDAFNPDVVQLVRELVDQLGRDEYDRAYTRGRDRDRGAALAFIRSRLAPTD
ncbi:BTAD domain-containing putative transcriptional regulator [Kitasatospora sp. NPDC056531]|uniref:BTAD domain-containing putative transcriptional regulator n=1 Tax=Kitasatospora sp. NPDC056531 TaxID=3345856 RepID=UPI00367C78A4